MLKEPRKLAINPQELVDKLQIKPEEIAPAIEVRIDTEASILNSYRQAYEINEYGGFTWPMCAGVYRFNVDNMPLVKNIIWRLNSLLHAHPNQTFYVLDPAAGFAGTLNELANTVRNSPFANRVNFVANNIGLTGEDISSGKVRITVDECLDLRSLKQNIAEGVLQFTNFAITDLPYQKLAGQVGIILEHNGLAYSLINDLNFPALASLLCPGGTIYSSTTENRIISSDSALHDYAKRATELGIASMLRMGVEYVELRQ